MKRKIKLIRLIVTTTLYNIDRFLLKSYNPKFFFRFTKVRIRMMYYLYKNDASYHFFDNLA